MIKILRIIARLNVGGPARHVIWLTKELQDDEFQTSLIAGTVPPGEEDMSYFAAENAVTPCYVPEMSRELSAKDIVSIFKIYKHICRASPDIIHTHTAKAGTIGRIAGFVYRWITWGTLIGRPRGVRMVHTFHGHVFHSYYGKTKTRIFLGIERILARAATDKIIVISQQQLREIHEDFGVGKKEQFRVVPLGIDLEVFGSNEFDATNVRAEMGALDGDIVVGFVGRLTEIKNIELLLNVAAMYNDLPDDAKPSLKFVIIGDGHLRSCLELTAEQLGVNGILTFLGNRTDTERLYKGLDIVALTSMNEGTPLSLIEGMASGRAVISTRVGGVIDLLGLMRDDYGGFQVCERGVGVEPGSVESYFNGLLLLARDEELRKDLARAGRHFVKEKYNKNRLVDEIKELYREIV